MDVWEQGGPSICIHTQALAGRQPAAPASWDPGPPRLLPMLGTEQLGKDCLLWQDLGHLTGAVRKARKGCRGWGPEHLGLLGSLLGETLRRQLGKGPAGLSGDSKQPLLSLTSPQGTQSQVSGRTFNYIHRGWMGNSMLEAGYQRMGAGTRDGEWVGKGQEEEGPARVCSTHKTRPPSNFSWDTPVRLDSRVTSGVSELHLRPKLGPTMGPVEAVMLADAEESMGETQGGHKQGDA